jgi:hypothetical protein
MVKHKEALAYLEYMEELSGLMNKNIEGVSRFPYADFEVLTYLNNCYLQPDTTGYALVCTPDEAFVRIVEAERRFGIEFGWEDFFDSIRDVLIELKLVKDYDELTDEEIDNLP